MCQHRPVAAPNRRFRGKSAEERIRARRERLIEAGLATFGTRGFHGVRVRDICAEAQLTERYFYESFANLEELFLAVYDASVDRVRVATEGALEALSARGDAEVSLPELIRAGLRAFFQTLLDEPGIARVILVDVLTINSDIARQSQVAVGRFTDLVLDVAGEHLPGAVELGSGPFELRLISTGVIGATVYLAMRWVNEGCEEPVEVMVEHAALFYESLGASLSANA